ncbi:MAG: hypothetical protein B7Z72_11365 [Gemmatimonadetes bacterium 21-71-4]|nr:MAG: hypothetical protein B7Z72_11365 [Gemmatimonadetes bacterium 21-71-4]
MRILFVCTGNTCRSPLAEAIARNLLIERGIADVEVASAGTSAWEGASASDGALLVGLERGLDLNGHRARQLDRDLVHAADLLLAMGPHHLERIEALGGTGKGHLLTAYASRGTQTRPYEPLDVAPADLDAVLDALIAQGAAGNVTIPHKMRVASRCGRLAPLAERTGAVNTFWTDGNALVGDNTDVDGFEAAVRALMGGLPSGAEIGVVGAGGAAAAVLAAIERWDDCHARLYNRTADRAHQLAARFVGIARAVRSADAAVSGAALVVNATAIGLADHSMPFPLDALRPDAAVLDLVYRPGRTALVRSAAARGHRADDGLRMLVEQGACAFERWFGVPPDRDLMCAAVNPDF